MLYVPISRQSRRLDSITRSPIFTHFSETVAGAAVIRAFQQEDQFQTNSNQLINNNARYFYIKWASNRWLTFYLDFFSAVIVFSSATFALFERNFTGTGISAAAVGLSVSYALQVTENLMWLVRQVAELETDAVSLERIKEYSSVEQEAAWHNPAVDDDPALKLWPVQGAIDIQNYSFRYRDNLPLVLHSLNASIRPGERIGVVGRTGAGKSSLTLALFRIFEAAEGGIAIDRRDISQMGLHLLRSRITILPQDPILFSGTLRSNLDPFDRHTDAELWEALKCSHLADWVSSQSLQMLHECGEGGNNLSAGQRQLVCLARAILRRSRVLILDEATAAVDLNTDQLLMTTVREYFANCTLIIIAHRLATIIDADRVMVMDKGSIVEFDAPKQLLANKGSIFFSLAHQSGLA